MDNDLFDTIADVTTAVQREVARAKSKFLPFNSAHEGFAVLWEEVDELWDEVRKNQRVRDKALMRTEAIQVAAMAVRFVMEVCDQVRADDAVGLSGDQPGSSTRVEKSSSSSSSSSRSG